MFKDQKKTTVFILKNKFCEELNSEHDILWQNSRKYYLKDDL